MKDGRQLHGEGGLSAGLLRATTPVVQADVLRNRETMSLSTEGQQQKAPELLSLAKVVADPAEPAVFPDSIPARPPSDSSLDEDSIGISRPLYLLVDAIFELQTHGFIWRQVVKASLLPSFSRLCGSL